MTKKPKSQFPKATNREEFLKNIQRDARREAVKIWDAKHPKKKNLPKGGRPTLKGRVFTICQQVWTEWGRKWPKKRKTQKALLEAVRRQYEAEFGPIHDDTLRTHVTAWIGEFLDFQDLPPSFYEHNVFRTTKSFVEFQELLQAQLGLAERLPMIEQALHQFRKAKKLPSDTPLRDLPWDEYPAFREKNYPDLFAETQTQKANDLQLDTHVKNFLALSPDQQKKIRRRIAKAIVPK